MSRFWSDLAVQECQLHDKQPSSEGISAALCCDKIRAGVAGEGQLASLHLLCDCLQGMFI